MRAIAPAFSVLREPAWSALCEALDLAVSSEGALPAARDVLVRPVQLLELMARDATVALGDDAGAAERLRLLLHLAGPFRGTVAEVRKLSSPKRGDVEGGYEPGILDHGALALVALAALRVAPADGARSLQALHGLALSAAAVEALGRLLRLHAPDGLATIVGALYLLDAVGTALQTPFVRPFADDPAERARWSALGRLFDEVLPGAIARAREAVELGKQEPLPWDGATAVPLELLEAAGAGADEPLTLVGQLDEVARGGKLPAGVRLVLASEAGVVPVRVLGGRGRELRAELPADAGPGWLGFSMDEAIAASNRFRRALRASLTAASGPGLAIPAEAALPLLERPDPERAGRFLAAPARTAGNRFEGRVPRIAQATLRPRAVRPGGVLAIAWRTHGAEAVRLDPGGTRLPPSGRITRVAAFTGAPLTFVLTPLAGKEGAEVPGPAVRLEAVVSVRPRILSLELTQGGRTSPLWLGQPLDVALRVDGAAGAGRPVLALEPAGVGDPIRLERGSGGAFHAAIPAVRLTPGLTVVAVLPSADGERTLDLRRSRPLALRAPRPIALVVVRPRVVEPALAAAGALSAEAPVSPAATSVGGVELSKWRALVRPSFRFSPALDAAGLRLRLPESSDAGDVEVSAARVTPAVDPKALAKAVAAAGAAVGLEAEATEPPWVDDGLAALLGPLSSADDPRVPELLEQLARRALLTPGFEHALWVCVVPAAPTQPGVAAAASSARGPEATSPAPPGFFRATPAAAAEAVAVCDLAGLAPLLRQAAGKPPPAPEPARRLRILGTFRDGLEVESVQEEERAAGPGAPCDGPLRAVTLDAAGRVVTSVPVRQQREGHPASVAALVPVAPEAVAVEIRRGAELERRFERTVHGPALGSARLTSSPWTAAAQQVAWSYTGPRPLVALALRRGAMRTEVQDVASCDTSPAVHLTRYRAADAFELWASDGWTPTHRDVEPAPGDEGPLTIDNPTPVIIRRLAAGRWFADVPPGWVARWTVNGVTAREGELVRLSPRVKGRLLLEATPPEGPGFRDEVWLEPEVR